MLKQRDGICLVAHFGQAQRVVVQDRGIVRIDGVKLLEEVACVRKLALTSECDGLLVSALHVLILT